MIKVVAAFFLLLGSGLIFKALVEMDAPSFRARPLPHRTPKVASDEKDAAPLRRAA